MIAMSIKQYEADAAKLRKRQEARRDAIAEAEALVKPLAGQLTPLDNEDYQRLARQPNTLADYVAGGGVTRFDVEEAARRLIEDTASDKLVVAGTKYVYVVNVNSLRLNPLFHLVSKRLFGPEQTEENKQLFAVAALMCAEVCPSPTIKIEAE